MSKYEIMFIVKTTIDEKLGKESVDTLKTVITSMNGKIADFRELGQKEFAYPVKKEISGFYYVFTCEADAAAVAEFDRKARIDENILRHLIINLDEE